MKIKNHLWLIMSLILISTHLFANCTSGPIKKFIGDYKLTPSHYKETIESNGSFAKNREICIYQIEGTQGVGNAYAYVLLLNGIEVDCGETTQHPVVRAEQKSNPNRDDYKIFDKMIAVGYYKNKEAAREKQAACVCVFKPKQTHRPKCPHK